MVSVVGTGARSETRAACEETETGREQDRERKDKRDESKRRGCKREEREKRWSQWAQPGS